MQIKVDSFVTLSLQALLSGCSAGGLASILHCDEFRDLFPSATKVKCLSDAGMFLDAYEPYIQYVPFTTKLYKKCHNNTIMIFIFYGL